MSNCNYTATNFTPRICDETCLKTDCYGNLSCNEDGDCTLSAPCGKTMTFRDKYLTENVLCHGGLDYRCRNTNKGSFKSFFCRQEEGAIQFNSTVVCSNFANQYRYNKDNMKCMCTTCEQCILFGCRERFFCDCTVEAYPFLVSTTPVDVSTANEGNFVKDEPSTIRVSQADRNSTTSISLVRQSTGVLPSQTTWPKAQTTMEPNTVTYSTGKMVPEDNGLTLGLIGGIAGGVVALLILVLIVFVANKRYRTGKINKKAIVRNPGVSFQHMEDQITVQSLVNLPEPEQEEGPVREQFRTSRFGNRSEENTYVNASSNGPQDHFYTSLSNDRSDTHDYDRVVTSSQQSSDRAINSTDQREGFYTPLSGNRNDTNVYDKIGN